jgi:polar amino acid transport system substrate-binding protein
MTAQSLSTPLAIDPPAAAIRDLLAPNGVLRVGVNLSNFLLVTGRTPEGDPVGVSPDLSKAFADHLGVRLKLVPYNSPSLIADAAGSDEWDIALIGAEPQRAAVIAFSPPYVEIEATYLVPAGSPFTSVAEVDAAGVEIAVAARTAYGLWLERNIAHARLVESGSMAEAFADFVENRRHALAGLRPGLIGDAEKLPGARLLSDRYATVQQAVGTPMAKAAALDTIVRFVEAAKASGLVAELIARHGVTGRLSVAPAAS